MATHSVLRVASLDATAAVLARHGRRWPAMTLMVLRGGMRAALVAGPMGIASWWKSGTRDYPP